MKMKLFGKSINALVCLLCMSMTAYSTVAVKMFSRHEGISESNSLKPRIYITNTGTEAITDITYNYYFTTEGTETPVVDDYWTANEDIFLISEGCNHYYVKYVLSDTLKPGQSIPENSGCIVGIHYNSWSSWDKSNDYSFNNVQDTVAENPNITVYSNGTLIYGTRPVYDTCTNLPPEGSAQLGSFAIFSTLGTIVSDSAVFTGGGALGSNVDVDVGEHSTVYGNVIAGRNAIIPSNATIYGSIYAKENVLIQSGATVTGTSNEGVQVAAISIPQRTITSGSADATIASNTTVTLQPGSYRYCYVNSNATLILTAGLYKFDKLILYSKSTMQFNAAASENVEIEAGTELAFNDSCELKFLNHGYAPCVKFYTNADTIRVGVNSKITGIIYAPQATLTMYAGAQCDGAVYAKYVTIQAGAKVSSENVNPVEDLDNDGVANILESMSGSSPIDSESITLMALPTPVLIDYSTGNTISYNLSKFYSEYAQFNDSAAIEMMLPAGSLAEGKSCVLLKVVNTPVNYNGTAISGFTLPAGYRVMSRFFAFQPNVFTGSVPITLKIPLVSNIIGVENFSVMYYTETSSTWSIYDNASFNPDDNTITVTLLKPEAVVVIAKGSSGVAYLDNGTVYNNTQTVAALDVQLEITDVAATATGSYSVYYTDYAIPSAPVAKQYDGSFENVEEDGTSLLRSIYTEGTISSTGTIVVNRVTVTSDAGVDYSCDVNYSVLTGQKLTLQASGKYYYYNNGIYSVAALYDDNYTLESFSIDGEGRIRPGADGVSYNYDYFIRDNLGTTRMVVNEDGEVTESTMYRSYGMMVPLMIPATVDNARDKFTTKEFDTESGMGLYYFGARYYDPELGIFISTDPMDQYWNTYSYCGGDPVNRIDPNGEYDCDAAGNDISESSPSNSDSDGDGTPDAYWDSSINGWQIDGDDVLAQAYANIAAENGLANDNYSITDANANSTNGNPDAQGDGGSSQITSFEKAQQYAFYGPANYFLDKAESWAKDKYEQTRNWQYKGLEIVFDLANKATYLVGPKGTVDERGGKAPNAGQKGIGGKGWRGDQNWKSAVNTVAKGGTINTINGKVVTKEEAVTLIQEANGKVSRIEEGHAPPNPHTFDHINYVTPSGQKATIQIQGVK